jgi:hypothetical protein
MEIEDKIRQPGERYKGEYRDIWNDHNHHQELEHNLINRKATWSPTTQTLLFAAYGLVLKSDIGRCDGVPVPCGTPPHRPGKDAAQDRCGTWPGPLSGTRGATRPRIWDPQARDPASHAARKHRHRQG